MNTPPRKKITLESSIQTGQSFTGRKSKVRLIRFFISLLGMSCAMMALTLQPFATAQDPFSDPQGFLAAAKERLRGNFLFEPDIRGLRNYLWTLEMEENRLNSKRELKRQCRTLSAESFESPQGVFVRRTIDDCGNLSRQDTVSVNHFAESVYGKSGGARTIEFRDKVWAITQFRLLGREILNGRASIVFAFRTPKKADFKEYYRKVLEAYRGPGKPKIIETYLKSYDRKVLKTEGRVWFDEEDKTLVKVEGEYYGNVSLMKGFFTDSSEISKGSSWRWEMEKFDGQTWLPKYREDLYKHTDLFWTTFYQEVTRYGNYRKRSAP